jgi:hypothetical protein
VEEFIKLGRRQTESSSLIRRHAGEINQVNRTRVY